MIITQSSYSLIFAGPFRILLAGAKNIDVLHARHLFLRLSWRNKNIIWITKPRPKKKSKAGFPLGEFVRANKQKANVIGW